MKSLIAKTLTSAVIAITAATAAHANSGKGTVYPPPEDHSWRSPAAEKYWEEREARAGTGATLNPQPYLIEPRGPGTVRRYWSPEQLEYWKKREAELRSQERSVEPDPFFPKFQYY